MPELTREALRAAGVPAGQVDAAVLFGGSILSGGEVFAKAMRAGVAKSCVIVGGAGHTTQSLRDAAREAWPRVTFAADVPEAEIFSAYPKGTRVANSAYASTSS